jgi:hypothetical protein
MSPSSAEGARPETTELRLALEFTGWAFLGLAVAYLFLELLMSLISFGDYVIVLTAGPPLAVTLGFPVERRLRRSTLLLPTAALVGVWAFAFIAQAKVTLLLSPLGLFLGPPGIVFSAVLLVGAFGRIYGPVDFDKLISILVVGLMVLLPLSYLSGLKFPNDMLGPALRILYLLIAVAWALRYAISRRPHPVGRS